MTTSNTMAEEVWIDRLSVKAGSDEQDMHKTVHGVVVGCWHQTENHLAHGREGERGGGGPGPDDDDGKYSRISDYTCKGWIKPELFSVTHTCTVKGAE